MYVLDDEVAKMQCQAILLSFYKLLASPTDGRNILADTLNRLAAQERQCDDRQGHDQKYPSDHLFGLLVKALRAVKYDPSTSLRPARTYGRGPDDEPLEPLNIYRQTL